MKELDFYTELICYNGVAGDYHEKLCAAVHGMLWHIKKTHNFTNDELGFILSIDEEDIEDMLTEGWDGIVNGELIADLKVLSNNMFELPAYEPTKEDKECVNTLLDVIKNSKTENYPTNDEVKEKLDQIMELMGFTDIDQMLEAAKIVNQKNKEEEAHCCGKNDVKSDCCSNKKKETPKKECKCNNQKEKDNKFHHEKVEIDLDKITPEAITNFFCNIINDITK